MAIYRDRPDILVWGRWHFADDNAVELDVPTAFMASYWDPRGSSFFGSMGEVKELHQFRNLPSNPRLTGQGYCGDADHWLNGGWYRERGQMPVDAEGIPLCCPVAPLETEGSEFDYEYDDEYDSLE